MKAKFTIRSAADSKFRVLNQVDRVLDKMFADGCQGAIVTVDEAKKTRSTEQNAFLWGQVYTPIAMQMGEATGTLVRTEVVHEFLKSMFSPRVRHEFQGDVFYVAKSTTKYSVEEFSDYIEKCTAWANERGVYFDG